MTHQPPDRDIEQALTAWMDDVAPKRVPARLLESTFTRTLSSRQARTYPWHRLAVLRRNGTGFPGRIVSVLLVALLGVALVAALAGGALRLTVSPSPRPTPSSEPVQTPGPTPDATVFPSLPPSTSVTPEARIPIQGPMAMVAGGSAIWILAPGRLDRIDPETNTVTGSVPLGPTSDLYNGLAVDATAVWATDATSALVYRVDSATLTVAATIPAGLSPKGILVASASVWVADVHGGTVLRIDPATDAVVATITVGPAGNSGPNWLASGLGSIWVDIPNSRTIVRIDPNTNQIQATIHPPASFSPCGGIAIAGDAVWLTSCSSPSHQLGRIDPASNAFVGTVDEGGNAYNPTVINGAPWISVDTGNADTGMLARIDPAMTIDRILVPGPPFGGGGDIVVVSGSVWVLDGYNNSLLRLPLAAFTP